MKGRKKGLRDGGGDDVSRIGGAVWAARTLRDPPSSHSLGKENQRIYKMRTWKELLQCML